MEYSAARTLRVSPSEAPPAKASALSRAASLDLTFSPDPRRDGEPLLDYGRRLHRSEMHRLKMKHRTGLAGREAALYRSQLMDHLVGEVSSERLGETGRCNVAVVAIGGYGRGELAPFSDVDLMFLVKSRRSQKEAQQIQIMLCLLWDMGLQVGHSVRTIKEALQMASEDLVSLNSMLDARLVAGDRDLVQEFEEKLGQAIKRSRKTLEEKVLRSIAERHTSQGGTAFIQEPDIKEAKGGLRDFHSIGWIVKSFYPGQNVEQVLQQHQVTPAEWTRACRAYEFLQRLRNELHFSSNRKTDVLSHSVLTAVAKSFDFRKDRFQKDSEAFLRRYYLEVRRIARVLDALTARLQREARPGPAWLASKLVRLSPGKASVKHSKVVSTLAGAAPEQWMRTFRYGQADAASLDEAAQAAIRQNSPHFQRAAFATPSIGADFRAILRNKGRVAPVIRQMHGLGFLGRVLPEFGRLTCQVQHDLYHKYTTDEHTLRALEVLDAIATGAHSKHAPYQKVLNEIHDSSSLYFAMLMHDTGKGLGSGHSAKGAALVAKALGRLGFDPDEGEKVQALVRHHLLMGHVSQRRNLDDPHAIEGFVKVVDRLDLLNMLLLLTYSDAQAVAPGVWTDWKDYLLWDLYHKAYDRLMFAESVSAASHAAAEGVRKQVLALLTGEMSPEALDTHFQRLPESYLLYTPVAHIVEQLRLFRKLDGADVVFEWMDHAEQGYSDLILVTRDHPGLFAQIAGGLSAFNLNILSAQLNTRDDGLVFDVFQVGSLAGTHQLHREDHPRVEKLLKKVISGQVDIDAYLKTHFKPRPAVGGPRLSFPSRIRIDNDVSPVATVIEVQAGDRIGLGYRIASALASFDLNIVFAKLATEKSHAFDVFYVRDASGGKVVEPSRVKEIEERLRADAMGLL
ncbi:MAG: [protein-PII] uridylyltransferase [Acidobacteria bacterium]|nr:[protein-PII] uridylyltransferase [Acidobacteriota bacterium]MCI0623850.1 [protein-PII] uridylyltransferase [Acidobacteriota bacterium]MCI0725003.1 [protein-PII] uridylyltransferase [Acidobacteriota bacterium]